MVLATVLHGFTRVLSEQREVDAAVLAVLNEAGMGREVVVLAMLEDEEAVGGKDVFLENEVGNLRQLRQGVGRIGKDEVKLAMALTSSIFQIKKIDD